MHDGQILKSAIRTTLMNHVLNSDYKLSGGVDPVDLYTGTKLEPGSLRNEYTRGCPAYMLDPKLRDGKKFPK